MACSLVHSVPEDPEHARSGALTGDVENEVRFAPNTSMLVAFSPRHSIVPIICANFCLTDEFILTEKVGPCRSLRQASN